MLHFAYQFNKIKGSGIDRTSECKTVAHSDLGFMSSLGFTKLLLASFFLS